MIDYAAIVDWIAVSVPFLVFFGFVWAPKTWTPGELVTAASMNTNIRDHLNETLRSQVVTDTGTEDDLPIDGPFSYVKFNNASPLTVTGALIDSGNINGARIVFEAINAAVTINHLDSGSASANQFTNDSGTAIVLGLGERAVLFYDSSVTKWRVGKASTGAIAQTLGAVNLHPDPYVMIWPAGDAAAPALATLALDGNSALARNTTTYKHGDMAPELKLGTTATVSTTLKWTLFSSLPVSWRGKTIGIAAWVYSARAGLGRMKIEDGGTGGDTFSEFHPGDTTWHWIVFTHTITGDATKLELLAVSDIAGIDTSEVSAIFDGFTITKGPSPPADVVNPVTVEGLVYPAMVTGDLVIGTDLFHFHAKRPFIVTNVSLDAGTAPTDAALIIDVNHWDGAAWTSMFSTKPQIADAADPIVGGAEPDGTYRYRCFEGRKNTDTLTDGVFDYDIDQIGSTLPGADLQVRISVLQFQDQLAAEKI